MSVVAGVDAGAAGAAEAAAAAVVVVSSSAAVASPASDTSFGLALDSALDSAYVALAKVQGMKMQYLVAEKTPD